MKLIQSFIVLSIGAFLFSACGVADPTAPTATDAEAALIADPGGDGPLPFEPNEEAAAKQKGPGTTGGSCTIEKCNGLLDPFGKLQCPAPGLCACVHGAVTAGCTPGQTSICSQWCPPKAQTN